MTCDIFIRSYYRDFSWLAYCLEAISRHCRGFRKVVLVVPASSRERLDWLGLKADETLTCPDYRDDYLGQQVTKLHADLLTDADFICHIDSDCIFQRRTRPADLFQDGRPRVLMARYARLDRHVPWKALTERFLGWPVANEFMRTPPYTFPRWLYPALRQHAQAKHGMPLEQYIVSQPPRGFSEFNALSAYAFRRHREHFTWVDVHRQAPPKPVCRVYWSWAGIDAKTRGELEALTRGT